MPVNAHKKSCMGPCPTPSRGNRQVETGKPCCENRQVERGSKGNIWNQVEKGSTKSATNNEVDRVSGAGRDRPPHI